MSEHAALRRLLRAAATLDGLDVRLCGNGGQLAGLGATALIGWPEISTTLAQDDPLDPAPRHRLALLVALHYVVAELGSAAIAGLRRAARPIALPQGHPLHLGPDWVRTQVPGGVLDLGVGVIGLVPGQDQAVPLPTSVADLAGLDVTGVWPNLIDRAERAAQTALHRATGSQGAPLMPARGCDALTLLTTGPIRARLASAMGGGHTRVSAPRRDRVWTVPGAAEHGRAQAVWLLTPAAQRGILEPLAVSGDAVTGVSSADPVHRRPGPTPTGRRTHRPPAQRSGSSPTGV